MAFLAPFIPALVNAGIGVGGSLLASKLGGKAGRKARKNAAVGIAPASTKAAPKTITGTPVANPANTPLQNFSPTTFNGGGLFSQFKDGLASIGSTAQRSAFIDKLAGLFPEAADLISGLRAQFEGDNSAFVQRGLADINQKRGLAVGNLRENLARRRVAGSSFGEDAISRVEAEFAKRGADFRAKADLDANKRQVELVQQEFKLRAQGVNTRIAELNLQGDLAAKLSDSVTKILAENARVREAALTNQTISQRDASVRRQQIQQAAETQRAITQQGALTADANRVAQVSGGNATLINDAGQNAAAGAGAGIGNIAGTLGSDIGTLLRQFLQQQKTGRNFAASTTS